MSNQVYDKFIEAVADGTAGDLGSGSWEVHLFDGVPVFDNGDDAMSDLPTPIETETMSVSLVGREVQAPQVTITGVAAGLFVRAVVVSRGSMLVRWIDTRADNQPVNIETTGDDIKISFPDDRVLRLFSA